MNVKELSRGQLQELKQNYFYGDEGVEEGISNRYDSADDIPDSVIFEKFGGISFVNDDFGCSAGKGEDEYDKRGNLEEKFEEVMSLINDIAHDFEKGRVSFDEALEQIKNEVVFLDEE